MHCLPSMPTTLLRTVRRRSMIVLDLPNSPFDQLLCGVLYSDSRCRWADAKKLPRSHKVCADQPAWPVCGPLHATPRRKMHSSPSLRNLPEHRRRRNSSTIDCYQPLQRAYSLLIHIAICLSQAYHDCRWGVTLCRNDTNYRRLNYRANTGHRRRGRFRECCSPF